ncbi:hypothetical protein H0A36_16640 [Endozoicomonas sp. SM1973]|uniref:Uncharacterized protein n=1 Tax=Spartinivicinus marinus TaxID=2994442 RepID=A0A853I7H5_9GAMM|nr:hypothetical protein [Spartinivicinus marinus]MCX4028827.1 hypothetical protein [Spartinivicinus marinus]NYZ67642.1 hypothetical protein [Spartinivicinus marinus]
MPICLIKVNKNIAMLFFYILFYSVVSLANDIERYHYIPKALSIERVHINNADSPPKLNEIPHLVFNNLVSENEELKLLPNNIWNGNQWTHFDEFISNDVFQKALAKKGFLPNFGNSIVQISGESSGLHLNTFGTDLATQYTAASIQYYVGWEKGKKVWFPNEKLCISGELKISTNYTEGQAVNQVMYTLHFVSVQKKMFFLNVMLFDSRSIYEINDKVHWDTQDTNTAIIISHAQSQYSNNPNIKYTSSVDRYGDALISFYNKDIPKIKGDYGFCINQSQFKLAINDINKSFNLNYSARLQDWKLDVAIIGVEINTKPNLNLPRGNGHIGISIGSMWAYNKSDIL